MNSNIEISEIRPTEYYELSIMVGELLDEIMKKINHKVFNFNIKDTELRAKDLISNGKYWVYMARDLNTKQNIGFVSLYESYALYSEGAYGTMPELYVRPQWRSKTVGQKLLKAVIEFAKKKNWHRIEVTTPPLPEFEKTLQFYESNKFVITGGRKLKIDIDIK